MGFDKTIEEMYLRTVGASRAFVGEKLPEVITAYPKQQRILVGLRATFIKQRLIWEGKISHRNNADCCGVCYAIWACRDCPLTHTCDQRFLVSAEITMMRAYAAYMREHAKFVKAEK